MRSLLVAFLCQNFVVWFKALTKVGLRQNEITRIIFGMDLTMLLR